MALPEIITGQEASTPEEAFAQAFHEPGASIVVLDTYIGPDGVLYYQVGCNGMLTVLSESIWAKFQQYYDVDDGQDSEETTAV